MIHAIHVTTGALLILALAAFIFHTLRPSKAATIQNVDDAAAPADSLEDKIKAGVKAAMQEIRELEEKADTALFAERLAATRQARADRLANLGILTGAANTISAPLTYTANASFGGSYDWSTANVSINGVTLAATGGQA